MPHNNGTRRNVLHNDGTHGNPRAVANRDPAANDSTGSDHAAGANDGWGQRLGPVIVGVIVVGHKNALADERVVSDNAAADDKGEGLYLDAVANPYVMADVGVCADHAIVTDGGALSNRNALADEHALTERDAEIDDGERPYRRSIWNHGRGIFAGDARHAF